MSDFVASRIIGRTLERLFAEDWDALDQSVFDRCFLAAIDDVTLDRPDPDFLDSVWAELPAGAPVQ